MAAARACSGSAIAAQTPPHGPVWAAPRVVSASVRARVQSTYVSSQGNPSLKPLKTGQTS